MRASSPFDSYEFSFPPKHYDILSVKIKTGGWIVLVWAEVWVI